MKRINWDNLFYVTMSLVFIIVGAIAIYQGFALMHSDPWGLSFCFVSLPMFIFGVPSFFLGIKSMRNLLKNPAESERKAEEICKEDINNHNKNE